jgi:transcriptional regulator with XRE-family HTH domain
MPKGKNLQSLWDEMPEERRKRIRAKSTSMKEEYVTLQELRKRLNLTQVSVSEALDIEQPNLSRLERSSDMLLSTLRMYIEALGGKLSITVELPESSSKRVILTGLGDLFEEEKGSR